MTMLAATYDFICIHDRLEAMCNSKDRDVRRKFLPQSRLDNRIRLVVCRSISARSCAQKSTSYQWRTLPRPESRAWSS